MKKIEHIGIAVKDLKKSEELFSKLITRKVFQRALSEVPDTFIESLNSELSYKLPIKQGNKTILLDPKDVLYIKASGYYVEIYTGDNKYVLRESLTNLYDVFFCKLSSNHYPYCNIRL